MRAYTLRDIEVGTEEFFTRQITRDMEIQFREITGDVNPMHQDDSFATEVSGGKYRRHIAFGMLTASLYSTLAGVYLPGRYSLIHSMEDLKFIHPVFEGDMLTVSGKVEKKEEDLSLILVRGKIMNQDGKCVSKAKIKILLMK